MRRESLKWRLLFWLDKHCQLWRRVVMLVPLLPGRSFALICMCLRHSSCKKILLALVCSASSELCRLILLSPSPFHLSVTAKCLSPARRLSLGLSMDRIEEVQRYLTLQYLVNTTTTGLQRLPSVPMPVWFWGLNVCVWGQMDTFMSAWVWIILQATSGAPHGTADCGKRGRWARGEGTPPVGSLTSIPTDRASPQNGRPKGYETILQDKCFSESSQTWCLSLSVLNFPCGSNSLLFPGVRGVFAYPLFGYAMYTRWEQFGEQCLAQGHSNVDKRSGDWAATPMINGRAPELQLPVIWTCHHISILSHLLWFIVVTYGSVAGRQYEGNAVRHEKTTLKQLVN